MNAILAEPQLAPSNGAVLPEESLANELLKSYRGKIGKLPRPIRHELCHRLNKSESATKIIAWVNELPEARAVFDTEFNGKGITPQNLSEWRKGGYLDWLRHQLACERVRALGDFPQDKFMLSRRQTDGMPEWHENQADVFFVQSGSATLVVGGTLVGAENTEPHEKRNGTIQGGVRQKLSAGDVVRIPPKVPHQLLLDGSPGFTYFVVKVKGY